MKKQRRTAGLKKILTVMLCAALVFGLAACGKKNPGGTTKTPTYQAKFDPYYLHPGLAEGSDWTAADVWYPVDSPDSLPMYLTYGYDKGYDDCQFVITWIDEEGYDYTDCLTVVDGMENRVAPGDVITMAAGCRHTVMALTELKLMEVQLGKDISVDDKQKFVLERDAYEG